MSGFQGTTGRLTRPIRHDKEDLMRLYKQNPPTPLHAAPLQYLQRSRLRRPRRLPTLIWTTPTARYLQRLQWLFGGG